MGICWSCHWGWPKPVYDIYKEAEDKVGDSVLHYGPAHIVWEDENFESDHTKWCLEHFDEYSQDMSEYEKQVVRESLEKLHALPMEVKCVIPKDYDENNPENYPPASGITMVKQ